MNKSLILALACAIFGKVDGFLTLLSLEVCSITFGGSNSYPPTVFHDPADPTFYTADLSDLFAAPEDISFDTSGVQYDPVFEFRQSSNRDYFFSFPGYPMFNGKVVETYLSGGQKQRRFFQYLWQHSVSNGGDCSCAGGGTNNFPGEQWSVDGALNQFHQQGSVEVKLCSHWGEPASDALNDHYVTLQENWNQSEHAGDQWDCDNLYCDELTELTEIEYRLYEVFTDTIRCKKPHRDRHGYWGCEQCDENEGFFQFETNGDPNFLQQCLNCRWLFGESCEFCQRANGCAACTQTATNAGFDIFPKGDACDWQYCGERCCEYDDEEAPPTIQPTDECVEEEPHGGGQGSTDYDCRTQDQRYAFSQALDPPGPYRTRYELPNPQTPHETDECPPPDTIVGQYRCYGDCENGVPYRCPPAVVGIDHCVDCNDEPETNLRGCEICQCSEYDPNKLNADHGPYQCIDDLGNWQVDQEYFWYSNAHWCVACSEFKDCIKCRNGGDYGGGGCDECDPLSGTVLKYDEEFRVWYCAETDDEFGIESTLAPPGEDGWEGLECLTKCEERRGAKNACNCGCDCNDCAISEPGVPNQAPEDVAPFYCIDCHFHAGCDQCYNNNEDASQDYFMLSKEHACENCQDVFGERCLFCNDFVGCAQCKTGYRLRFSNCCQMWYCEYLPTQT